MYVFHSKNSIISKFLPKGGLGSNFRLFHGKNESTLLRDADDRCLVLSQHAELDLSYGASSLIQHTAREKSPLSGTE